MSEETKTLDLTKPLRLKRNGDYVKFIGMDPDKAGKVVIKYVCAPYNYEAAYKQELENILEPEPLTWAEAMQAMADGKKVRQPQWSEGFYLSLTSWRLPTFSLRWSDLIAAEWEILEETK